VALRRPPLLVRALAHLAATWLEGLLGRLGAVALLRVAAGGSSRS
jgi:hypothetical protein